MSRKTRARYGRDAPDEHQMQTREQSSSFSAFVTANNWDLLINDGGYRPVMDCPEVQMCIGIYADLISSMTIHLMASGDKGDTRIKNELSRKLDISPARDMTRTTFIQHLVRTLMATGNQVTLPVYDGELLSDLVPISPTACTFAPDGRGSYTARISGKVFRPEEILHFVLNPDKDEPWRGTGYKKAIQDAVKGLRQSDATRKALMESPTPSIIVKVDGLSEDFSNAEGRAKLRRQFLDTSEAGEPWFIPAEAFDVKEVRPMSLNDLAIAKNMELDKRAIAAVFGVPPFLVGIGDFNVEEYRLFVGTRVMTLAKIIEQELTKKLLYSSDLYWKFSTRSLYSYSLTEMINAGAALVDHMAMRRNEWRDWLGMSPDKDMDELLALENYIPSSRLGDQKKLEGGDDDGSE